MKPKLIVETRLVHGTHKKNLECADMFRTTIKTITGVLVGEMDTVVERGRWSTGVPAAYVIEQRVLSEVASMVEFR